MHQRHPAAQQQGGGVEWYASSSGAAQYGAGSYGYEMPASGGGGGAAYGSFENEAPLLEGLRACCLTDREQKAPLVLLIARRRLNCTAPAAAAAAAACRPPAVRLLTRLLPCLTGSRISLLPCPRAWHRHTRHSEPHTQHPHVPVRLAVCPLRPAAAQRVAAHAA